MTVRNRNVQYNSLNKRCSLGNNPTRTGEIMSSDHVVNILCVMRFRKMKLNVRNANIDGC